MSFKYLNLFEPNEHKEVYHIRKPNEGNFFFEIRDKKNIYVGEKLITFETNDRTVKNSIEIGFNDIKLPYAYGEENLYFMLNQKYISIQEYENSTEKNSYQYLYEKDDELKGDNITDENEGKFEYGNDSLNCKFISQRF